MIPAPLAHLIRHLSKLPGLGPRSAQRAALHLLTHPESLSTLQRSLIEVSNTITTCEACGNIGLASPCHVCTDEKRDISTICVVENIDDLWAIERAKTYKGLYHVLGGVVSALDGIGPEDLNFAGLQKRAEDESVQEVILALGASIDGQTTSHLIAQRLKAHRHINVTMLAKGIPVGAEVDYLDDGTLTLALEGRRKFG